MTTCRALGFGVSGPIPWTAADRYLIANGYGGDDYADTMELLTAMDAVYLERANAEKKKTGGG